MGNQQEEKIFHRECKFFLPSFNHSPHCLWPAILSPGNSPEELKNGCGDKCKWDQLTRNKKDVII